MWYNYAAFPVNRRAVAKDAAFAHSLRCLGAFFAAIRCREAYFHAWRIAKFGGDFDPIRIAVDEAVAAFSFYKDDAGRESDRSLWLKIANRAGLDAFLDAFDQKASEIEELERDLRRLRLPAASFQKLLNKRFPKDPPSPKATEDKTGFPLRVQRE